MIQNEPDLINRHMVGNERTNAEEPESGHNKQTSSSLCRTFNF